MALPKSGLSLVLEGFKPFEQGMDVVNKKLAENAKQTKEAAKGASPLSGVLDKVGVSVDSVKEKIAKFTGVNQEAIDGVTELAGAFGPMVIAAAAAVVGIVALGAAFLALGNRGAPLQELGIAFDHITASVGLTSKALLTDLRKASNGMVADFDLIKIANTALLGETGKLGIALGKNLPKLLEIARVASDATGKSLGETFDTLVEGVKKGAARQLKSVGIVVNATTANEAYAESIGKTAAQLTDEEQRVALLNATLEKGQGILDQNTGAQESNADKMDRASASITNILDALSIAVQPAFGAILDIVNSVLGGVENAVRVIAPYVNFIAQIVGNLIKGIGNALFGKDGIGQKIGEGAYNAFKSFAAGISFAANKLIFPAIIAIAKFIADLLIGLSPPPKGPLSKIDKGGENIMKAWLDGITGVSLDPVDEVAKQVSDALGAIGKATLPAVNKRLAELDAALLPFQQRLDIVKSQFEAISEPAKAALDAIDRQTQAAQDALANGDAGAADTIRRLDAARAAIQGQLDAQQQLVDQQQIQLGLATASQAQERALLNIRKAVLEATQKTTTAADKAAGKIPKEPKAPAGGAAPVPQEAPGGGGLGAPTSSVLDQFGAGGIDPNQIAQTAIDFAGAGNIADFQANSDELQTQLKRIGSVDIGSKLKDKFKGLTDIFDPANKDSVVTKITTFVSDLAGDDKNPNSVAHFIAQIPTSIEGIQDDITTRITDGLGAVFDPANEDSAIAKVTAFVAGFVGGPEVGGSVANFFSMLPQRVSDAASGLFDKLKTDVFDPVTAFLTGSEPGSIQDILNTAITFFEMLPGQITMALQGFGATLYTAVALPVINVMNAMISLVESGVKQAVTSIASFLGSIADGIDGLGLGVDTSGIHNIVADLKNKAGKISFGQISTALPAFLAPAAATGGMFSKGLVKVGEKGPEYVGAADKIGVLPAELTRVLDGLGSILAAPAPMTVPGGDTYNSNASTYNFNGVQSDNDARRRYNALRAGMR